MLPSLIFSLLPCYFTQDRPGSQTAAKQIKQYILEKVDSGDSNFVHAAVDAYSVSMNTVYRYLAEMEEDGLIERKGRKYHLTNQRKRLCQRLDQFKDVELNFENIDEIGQGFAHELFVVFQKEHPDTNLIVSNAGEAVTKMINHVKS